MTTPNQETVTTPEGELPEDMIPRTELNKALNALGARNRKEISAMREEFAAQFAALANKEPEPTPPGKDPELVKLQKQVEAQQKALDERERMIADEKMRQQDSFARQSLHEAMTAMGVKPELAPFVISHLYADQKKIKNRDGSLFFETGDEIEPEVDFRKGIEKFLKTPAGQHFVSPKQVEGTGGRTNVNGKGTIVNQSEVSIADFLKNRRTV